MRSSSVVLLIAAFVFGTGALHAQQAAGDTAPSRRGECYRFAFGPWTPPLDWATSGQAPRAVPPPVPDPGGARGDASHAGLSGDSTLMLYPPWWPVGVLVRFRERSTDGDTLRGQATALVADGRLTAPTSRVMVLRMPCHAPPRDSTPGRDGPF